MPGVPRASLAISKPVTATAAALSLFDVRATRLRSIPRTRVPPRLLPLRAADARSAGTSRREARRQTMQALRREREAASAAAAAKRRRSSERAPGTVPAAWPAPEAPARGGSAQRSAAVRARPRGQKRGALRGAEPFAEGVTEDPEELKAGGDLPRLRSFRRRRSRCCGPSLGRNWIRHSPMCLQGSPVRSSPDKR